MSARHKARRRALDVLYQSDVRDVPRSEVLEQFDANSAQPTNPYIRTLVEGVDTHSQRIDELLATYSRGWTLERMPSVDRNVLRLGAWELLWGETPEPVAISEAVALASELSTDDSGAFVNGLLSRLAEVKPRLVLD